MRWPKLVRLVLVQTKEPKKERLKMYKGEKNSGTSSNHMTLSHYLLSDV